MSLNTSERQEISDLASRATDGGLDAAGQARLEELLGNSAQARAFYVRFMAVSAGLAWEARNNISKSDSLDNGGTSPASEMPKPPSRSRYQSWRYTWGQVGAAAAVLVLALFGAWLMRPKAVPPVDTKDPGVATLSSAVNIEWDQAQEPRHLGNVLKSGWLRMKSGLAEVQCISGTDVWMQGPASFRLDSARQGYLASGKLVVQVPHGSEGFQVDFPYGRVVDRGTAFAMDLRADSATIHVLEGVVVVTPTQGEGKAYVAGQAITLDNKANVQVGLSDPHVFEAFGYAWNGASFELTNPGGDPGHHHGYPWGPQAWKGSDPLEAIGKQLGCSAERWDIIKPILASYLEAQWELKCLGFVPDANDYSCAAWDLYYGTQSPGLTDEELKARLDAYRVARESVRWRRNQTEKDLIDLLTTREEASLVDMGYLR